MAVILRFRNLPWRQGRYASRRRWRRPALGTIRLAVLLGIAAALFLSGGVCVDQVPTSASAGRSSEDIHGAQAIEFAFCGPGNRENCVVDGDTIHYGGAKIRLEDIDAPETHRHRCAAELALGRRATERLLELMNAGPFTVLHRGDRDQDRYGRKLRTIERDGISLGDILVSEGLARRWDGGRRGWCG